jgi:hypothetical protein
MIFENSILIEIPLGSGALSEITFPTQPFLRGKTIQAIEVVQDQILTVAPSGLTVISAADAGRLVLNFRRDRQDDIQQIPANDLVSPVNFGIVKFIRPRIINWDISTVRITATLTAANLVLPLQVYYKNEALKLAKPTQGTPKRK